MFENVAQVFQKIDWHELFNLIKLLYNGMLVSLKVFFLTLLFSIPLGMLVALGRKSKKVFISWPLKQYILVVRGTPLLIQIWFVYFAPFYIFNSLFNFERFTAAIVAFSLNYAAYFAEIFRGGLESIPQGQYEAASVLGYNKVQTFFRIILPQVVKRVLPPMSNEVITLVKDTALVYSIGISELFRAAKDELSRTSSMKPIIIAAVFYLVMNWAATKVMHAFEKKLDYYK